MERTKQPSKDEETGIARFTQGGRERVPVPYITELKRRFANQRKEEKDPFYLSVDDTTENKQGPCLSFMAERKLENPMFGKTKVTEPSYTYKTGRKQSYSHERDEEIDPFYLSDYDATENKKKLEQPLFETTEERELPYSYKTERKQSFSYRRKVEIDPFYQSGYDTTESKKKLTNPLIETTKVREPPYSYKTERKQSFSYRSKVEIDPFYQSDYDTTESKKKLEKTLFETTKVTEPSYSYKTERKQSYSHPRKEEKDPLYLSDYDTTESKKASKQGALVVAAIDFGTTYSGWAFSFKHDYERDPTKVSAKIWSEGQLTSQKGPTCILIRPDGETVEAFAFGAETRYSQLSENNEHKKWYYFRRFKMALWKKSIHNDTMLEDESGRKLPALRVFSLSIRHMKDDLTNISESQVAGLKADDIHWVLTVPAIWNDSAKHFMRLAAEQAGIASDKLSLALEPEAASLYCRHLPVQREGGSSISTLRVGKKYLVLDAGGGTIDITVHEVCAGGNLKEVHKASGGDWGGTKVDAEFMDFLGELTDTSVMQIFKEDHMEDYIELLRDFESKKRSVNTTKGGKITIKVPLSFLEFVQATTGQSMENKLQTTGYGNRKTMVSDKFRLDADILSSFFTTSLLNIVEHVSDLLQKPECKGVEAILMVGGYSESMLLQDTVKQHFPHLKILIPPEAGLAVLKGAVIYGHCPSAITERVSKYTYGISVTTIFDKNKHPWSKREVFSDGTIRCVDLWSVIVTAGDKLVVGEAQNEREYFPVYEDQEFLHLPIFVTSDKDPKFTTDVGSKKVGSVTVPVSGSGTHRSVGVRMIFGGTEITVECVEKATGKITQLDIAFLM